MYGRSFNHFRFKLYLILLSGFLFMSVSGPEWEGYSIPTQNTAKRAEFKGDLDQFIADNLTYPVKAVENGIEGRVLVQFIVNSAGEVNKVEVKSEKLGYGLEEESVRVVKLTSGQWNPAVNDNGEKVNMVYRIPIRFALQNSGRKKKKR